MALDPFTGSLITGGLSLIQGALAHLRACAAQRNLNVPGLASAGGSPLCSNLPQGASMGVGAAASAGQGDALRAGIPQGGQRGGSARGGPPGNCRPALRPQAHRAAIP